jgi:hypothetical protein
MPRPWSRSLLLMAAERRGVRCTRCYERVCPKESRRQYSARPALSSRRRRVLGGGPSNKWTKAGWRRFGATQTSSCGHVVMPISLLIVIEVCMRGILGIALTGEMSTCMWTTRPDECHRSRQRLQPVRHQPPGDVAESMV